MLPEALLEPLGFPQTEEEDLEQPGQYQEEKKVEAGMQKIRIVCVSCIFNYLSTGGGKGVPLRNAQI